MVYESYIDFNSKMKQYNYEPFLGLHDRKVCVLGLCHLLQMPDSPAVSGHAQQLVPSLILLFEGLKRAYAARYVHCCSC